jgi:cell division protein FtsQ
MARNQGPPDDDSQGFYRGSRGEDSQGRASDHDEEPGALDERIADIDQEDESPFLRAQKRIPVRRGALPKKTATRLRWVLLSLIALTVVIGGGLMVFRYGAHSWRFSIESSDSIQVSGARNVSREQVLKVFGDDISRNIFSVRLADRKRALEDIPWIESAAVMRLLPNRIAVNIKERVPVAFVQLGSQVALIDASGVIMNVPAGGESAYSFPVIIGMAESEPLSTRAPRMRTYTQLITELDSCNPQNPQDCLHYSRDLSEVDLSDPNDLKVTVTDPAGALVVHMGDHQRAGIFLDRYKVYVANLQKWRAQYPNLSSVDLRYEQQVILDPASGVAQPPQAGDSAEDAKPKAGTATKKPHARKR